MLRASTSPVGVRGTSRELQWLLAEPPPGPGAVEALALVELSFQKGGTDNNLGKPVTYQVGTNAKEEMNRVSGAGWG